MNERKGHLAAAVVIVALYIAVLWLIFHPVSHASAQGLSARTAAIAYIECDPTGCQIDMVAPGYDMQEYWVQSIVYEEK